MYELVLFMILLILRGNQYFCWVLDETKATPHENAPEQYLAWGHNKDLQLVSQARQEGAHGPLGNQAETKPLRKKAQGAGPSKTANRKKKSEKPQTRKSSAAKPFDSWGVFEVTQGAGSSEKATRKMKPKKTPAHKSSAAKPFDSWGVFEVCELVRSLGKAFEDKAAAMQENGIDGHFLLAMLASDDTDLTTPIANGGLGFSRLQLKRVMFQIEEYK